MTPIGGGITTTLARRHFWLTLITFTIIVGGLWLWHRAKIKPAVQAEKDRFIEYQAERNAQKMPPL